MRRVGLVLVWTFLLLLAVFGVVLNVPLVRGSGTIYIRADGSIDPPTANITSADNVTYTFTDSIYDSIVVERDNITIDGAGYKLEGTGAPGSTGIFLSLRQHVTIKNTLIKSFDYGIYLSISLNNNITGNNVANNNYGIYLNLSPINNTISGNNITNNNYGIWFHTSSGNIISENNVTANNNEGIMLDSSSDNNVISGNNVTNNFRGIYLILSDYNNISENNVTNNTQGIVLGYLTDGSNNNIISGNIVANSDLGIWLDDSSNNNISGNNVTNNNFGIVFYDSSNNIISGNNLTNNGVSGIGLSGSSNNYIYHNNFVDNYQQVSPSDTVNVWDDGYPSGGNYWSDHIDVDNNKGPYQNITGSDGIWDNPYIINSTNTDRYPLAFPYETQPPTITILSPENKTYAVNASIPLTFTVDEFASWIGYSLNGQPNATITGNTTLPALSDGRHRVVVYANDTFGNMGASDIMHFTVDTTPPTADAGDDQTVNEDTLVTFDGSASTDENGIAAYTWTFTDITPQTLSSKNPTYTFATPGTYTITLTVTDPAGNTATDTVTIAVLDVTKPLANAGSNRTVNEDTPTTLDGSASTDNVGTTAYIWTFTDVTLKTLTGEKPTYTFNTPGVYTVTLNVTDGAGNWATDTVIITVLDTTKPVANAGQDRTVNVGTTVAFDAGDSTDNVGIVSYEWDFGDGTTGTGVTTSHVYSTPNNYTVKLTVKDAAGNTATHSITVTVESLPAETFPTWLIGAAIATITLAAATAAIILWKRRK